ncbi:MAG TPA: N-6 DNA methylase [Methanocorpusculum sp.]|nr:N-6 DNA methylase [Methanocorpusculum sp.]HJJ81080.1 N-6 DNA methylase [Methanocorpusculum sp.]
MSFEQVFNNIDDVMYQDGGTDSELDYIEQTSWIIFLRYLDDLENERALQAELDGGEYEYMFDEQFRWSNWAAPKGPDGKIDYKKVRVGDDLIEFVRGELFPYLAGFKERAESPKTVEYKIGEIFSGIKCKIESGYNLREILDYADGLSFQSAKDKHELSSLYEVRIRRMGNAGRSGGQYYTPRPLIRAMIQVLEPKIGETIYDGSAGSCGFLCEAYEYLSQFKKTTEDARILGEETFYAKELRPLAFVIGTMNLILHGITVPNLVRMNTLSENAQDIQEKDRYDVILTNPPFGSGAAKSIQKNFAFETSENAYLFLQHYIKSLKAGGRAGIVIKNTFLSGSDNANVGLRRYLLETCSLDIILEMPQKTFQGAGVNTVVLFFEKGKPTKNIWYYSLDPGRNLGKKNPLNDDDLAEFVEFAKTKPDSPHSWTVKLADIDEETVDLTVRNPNAPKAVPLREPTVILEEMKSLDAETAKILNEIDGLL